jgi:hypothetical protein
MRLFLRGLHTSKVHESQRYTQRQSGIGTQKAAGEMLSAYGSCLNISFR